MNDKAKKQINPMQGAISTLGMMAENIRTNGKPSWRADVLNTTLVSHEIDTCRPPDTGTWETGVRALPGGDWVIVEQYDDKAKATLGHTKWVDKLTNASDMALTDIHVWGVV